MKTIFMLILAIACTCQAIAQTSNTTHRVTAFKEYQPAIVTLTNGKVVRVNMANIFLKKSTLIYKGMNDKPMEALIDNIKCVDFKNAHYDKIDTLLACRIDTLGKITLYKVTKIDIDALKGQILNNRTMTNIDFGDNMLTTQTIDDNQEDQEYPIANNYYYLIKGKLIQANDHTIDRFIQKDKRQMYMAIINGPDFSWTDNASLSKILKVLKQ